ncbi:hypothetical protein [Gemmatimonas sp.]|uniref:hypothetical protein n=1 Tax=Gemmatimonas sp. TaxID=1962908 RepID=UPI003342817E
MSNFDRESQLYFSEVDTLAAQYVRDGYEPMEAKRMASEAVRRRRREAARTRNNPDTLRKLAALGGFK